MCVLARCEPADISVLLPENLGSRELATEKATKAPEGATAGAGTGAVIGGALGWLAGIGALAISRFASFYRGRANHGGARWRRRFHRCTRWHGPPEYEAKRYEGHLQKGGILLAVHCDTSEEIDEAKEIMQRTDAEDISSTSESSANIRRHMLPRRKQERAIEVSRDRESAAAKRQSSWPSPGARGIPSSKDHCS